MWTAKARVLTTHSTRDGSRLTKEDLERYVVQCNESKDRMPFNVAHDSTRQIGFIVPGSAVLVKLEDGEYAVEVEIRGYENDAERRAYCIEPRKKEVPTHMDSLKVNCTKRKDFNCYTYQLPASIFTLLGEKPNLNKDRLLVVDSPNYILDNGILVADDFVVNFHPFLRRSFSKLNAYNLRLINKVREVMIRNPQLNVSFSVIHDVVSLKSELSNYVEWDYVWGPKLPKDLSKLKTGITQHVASESDAFMENIELTDFWWHRASDSLMVLEIEETRNKTQHLSLPQDETKYFPLRYCHLHYDESNAMITHLDLAVRVYPEDKFDFRVSQNDISKSSKNDSDRVKLVRIDGALTPKDAFDIISLFFHGNSDVRQYFEGNES
ncbi:hypothetical protein GF415_01545 [Candidatus Micrarchaeota archaeon]|nr:hypothetical protein [Candidatus Micrarchaeota archaeon]